MGMGVVVLVLLKVVVVVLCCCVRVAAAFTFVEPSWLGSMEHLLGRAKYAVGG